MVINHGLVYSGTAEGVDNDHLAKYCPNKPAETKTSLGLVE